jgi:hypothetical protein
MEEFVNGLILQCRTSTTLRVRHPKNAMIEVWQTNLGNISMLAPNRTMGTGNISPVKLEISKIDADDPGLKPRDIVKRLAKIPKVALYLNKKQGYPLKDTPLPEIDLKKPTVRTKLSNLVSSTRRRLTG